MSDSLGRVAGFAGVVGRRLFGPFGLRTRVVVAFGAITLLVSTAFAASAYALARSYLLSQRTRIVTTQTVDDADFVRRRLEAAGADVSAVLTAAGTSAGTAIVVHWKGEWYSSSLDIGSDAVPAGMRQLVGDGDAATQRIDVEDQPMLVVGVRLDSVGAELYELAPLTELDGTLKLLSTVLAGGALVAFGAGSVLGLWASRSVVRPLNRVAGAAAEIAAGRLDTRLEPTTDPELATIVGSFNSMVDTLQQRLVRDARLAADVSHELRSPLTTLVASVELLEDRRAELSPHSAQLLDLVSAELQRFRRLLDDLLELARADAGLDSSRGGRFDLAEMLQHTLEEVGLTRTLLVGDKVSAQGDKTRLNRLFRNLIENAESHARGLHQVRLIDAGDEILVYVDDCGPGIPHADRERVFERFATSGGGRGSSKGTGLGLALAAETAIAHGGSVWCTDRPGGGARFVVTLPKEQP